MHVQEAGLCGLKLVSTPRHKDSRGWFTETYNRQQFEQAGLPTDWAQDNQSHSHHGVLRGLHFQTQKPQGKLVRVLSGSIWDAVVDLRPQSPDFGRWVGLELTAPTTAGEVQMLWIPEGFAHGFLVLSECAEIQYKVTQPYDPGSERTLLWNDRDVGIAWPLDRLHVEAPLLSSKDAAGLPLSQAVLV